MTAFAAENEANAAAEESEEATETAEVETAQYEDFADSWRYQDGEVRSEEELAQTEDGFGPAPQTGMRRAARSIAASKSEADAEAKGVDVSCWNKTIDWAKVKNSGIRFAILRCGYGQDQTNQDDSTFLYNAKECERLGIPYGVYLYSYAKSVSGAKGEANHTLRLLKGRKITLPVYYDLEEKSVKNSVSNSTIAQMAQTYCDMIEAKGYDAGIYANLDWWKNTLTSSNLDKYEKWVAQYNTKCNYAKDYRIWQYSSDGSVPGISGRVDVNYLMQHDGNAEFLNPQGGSAQKPPQVNGPQVNDQNNAATTPGTPKPPAYQETPVSYQVTVTVSELNYRTGPGTGYDKKGSYKKGAVVSIVATSGEWGKMSNGYWIKLTSNTQKVTASAPSTAPTVTAPTAVSYQVKVTVSALNYRTGPGTNYAKKGSYKKGKVLTIKATKNGWGKMSNGYWIKLSGNTKKVTASYKVKVTVSVLNYRTGPGTKYKKKGSYKKNKVLTIKSTKNGWGKMSNGYWIKLSGNTKKI